MATVQGEEAELTSMETNEALADEPQRDSKSTERDPLEESKARTQSSNCCRTKRCCVISAIAGTIGVVVLIIIIAVAAQSQTRWPATGLSVTGYAWNTSIDGATHLASTTLTWTLLKRKSGSSQLAFNFQLPEDSLVRWVELSTPQGRFRSQTYPTRIADAVGYEASSISLPSASLQRTYPFVDASATEPIYVEDTKVAPDASFLADIGGAGVGDTSEDPNHSLLLSVTLPSVDHSPATVTVVYDSVAEQQRSSGQTYHRVRLPFSPCDAGWWIKEATGTVSLTAPAGSVNVGQSSPSRVRAGGRAANFLDIVDGGEQGGAQGKKGDAERVLSLTDTGARFSHSCVSWVPSKPLAFEYSVEASEEVELQWDVDPLSGFFLHRFTLPSSLGLEPMPKTFVFLLDVSGSMMGNKWIASGFSLRRLLSQLHPSDTFNIIPFTHRASQALFTAPRHADTTALRLANEFWELLIPGGASDPSVGIRSALDLLRNAPVALNATARPSVVMISDCRPALGSRLDVVATELEAEGRLYMHGARAEIHLLEIFGLQDVQRAQGLEVLAMEGTGILASFNASAMPEGVCQGQHTSQSFIHRAKRFFTQAEDANTECTDEAIAAALHTQFVSLDAIVDHRRPLLLDLDLSYTPTPKIISSAVLKQRALADGYEVAVVGRLELGSEAPWLTRRQIAASPPTAPTQAPTHAPTRAPTAVRSEWELLRLEFEHELGDMTLDQFQACDERDIERFLASVPLYRARDLRRLYDLRPPAPTVAPTDVELLMTDTPTPIGGTPVNATAAPTESPTQLPTQAPTVSPTAAPTTSPTTAPTANPTTNAPTSVPTSPPSPLPFPTLVLSGVRKGGVPFSWSHDIASSSPSTTDAGGFWSAPRVLAARLLALRMEPEYLSPPIGTQELQEPGLSAEDVAVAWGVLSPYSKMTVAGFTSDRVTSSASDGTQRKSAPSTAESADMAAGPVMASSRQTAGSASASCSWAVLVAGWAALAFFYSSSL